MVDQNIPSFHARVYCLLLMVLRGFRTFQLQHILTLFTMAVGSLALSATLFTGEGALLKLWEDLDRMMGNWVVVYPDAGPGQNLLNKRAAKDLTDEDFNFIQQRLSFARYVVPRYFGKITAEFGGIERNIPLDGIPERLETEPAFHIIGGVPFSEPAKRAEVWECLLTRSAAELFRIEINQHPRIRMEDQFFQVVGLIEDPPEADHRFKSRIVIPYYSAQLLWGKPGTVPNIVVSWEGHAQMEKVIQALRSALDECRAEDAYVLSSSQFTIQKRKNIVSNFMMVGTLQAAFCILIASIGVVNVMLANVVRRTREFAIRAAMGAYPGDLIFWVLIESFMMGFLGAVIGIIAAMIFSPPLCHLISLRIAEASQLEPYIGFKGIFLPILVCSLGGLAAGIIPALRVRRLDILRILRAE